MTNLRQAALTIRKARRPAVVPDGAWWFASYEHGTTIPLEDYTPELGDPHSAGDVEDFIIEGGAGYTRSTNAGNSIVRLGNLSPTEFEIQVLGRTVNSTTEHRFGAALRYNAESWGDRELYYVTIEGLGEWTLFRTVDSDTEELADGSIDSFSPNIDYKLIGRITDPSPSIVRIKLDILEGPISRLDTTIDDTDDNRIEDSQYAGIIIRGTSARISETVGLNV